MPKKYKPFDVMTETNARERLRHPNQILWGPIGSPYSHMSIDDQVSWLDLVVAAPPGTLEKSDRHFLELTAGLLSKVRLGAANKSMVKLLGKSLRQMGLTPSTDPTPEAVLDAFDGRGKVN